MSRWREPDGVWRATADTAFAVSDAVTPSGASFVIASENPATDGLTLPFALPRRSRHGRIRHQRAAEAVTHGAGRRCALLAIPPGALPQDLLGAR